MLCVSIMHSNLINQCDLFNKCVRINLGCDHPVSEPAWLKEPKELDSLTVYTLKCRTSINSSER